MATLSSQNQTTRNQTPSNGSHPDGHHLWFSPETGIYSSTYPSLHIPSDPNLDVVSFIFSKTHDGVSALADFSSGFSISYIQLYPLVKSMASGLHQMGISQGDVVLLLLPNSIYFPVIFLAVLSLGAIATTMNPLSSFTEVRKQTLGCCLSLAFTVPENVEKLGDLGVTVIEVPENGSFDSNSLEYSAFHWLISADSNCCPRPVINQQDAAAIMYSSGTTGSTKAVVLTHRNLITMVETFVRFEASLYENLGSENVYLAVLPMFHIYGLSLFVMGLLSLGSAIVVMKKFDANEMVKAIDQYRVTHFPVVPPLLMALIKSAKGAGTGSLGSLKQVCCGAAPLTRKSIEEFVQTLPHVDFIQGYGMTESTAVATRGFNTRKLRNYSSIGLLAPNMQAKVVDLTSGSFLPSGNCGELWLRGPAIMKGYLNNVEATISTVDKEGWLHTGDIVSFDQDGYLYMVARVKEIIKYKGFQIAPADLESILISHPDILDAAVIGVPDEDAGEVPVAFVVTRPGSDISQAAILNYVAKQVSPYKKLRKVVFTYSIPKSAAGKILIRELRNFLGSRL